VKPTAAVELLNKILRCTHAAAARICKVCNTTAGSLATNLTRSRVELFPTVDELV
jgi:hypothetical protein